MNYNIYLLLLLSLSTTIGYTQKNTTKAFKYNKNKGKLYFYWGGNRSKYSKSDIEFKGENYNFTLENVHADDKPKGWHIDYINPARMTIPQTNFRIGYYFKDHYQVSFGIDHMKYVVTRPQKVIINGYIDFDGSEGGDTSYNGVYNNDIINLIDDKDEDGDPLFFAFEHTDGLNYLNFEIARVDDLGKYFNLNPNKIQVNLLEGFGIGALYPKTNATIIGKERNDEFKMAGYGISAQIGIGLVLFNHLQIQTELKGGFINMPWIRTTSDGDSAKQNFWFIQQNITLGYVFQLFNQNKKEKN